MYKFNIQESKKVRVIIDTDAACEADDQYAIVHALLTPKLIVRGIIAEQFRSPDRAESVEKSYNEINRVLELMDMKKIPVIRGYGGELAGEDDIPESEGADFIINEALSDSDKPLFILCQGAVTNVAIALRKRPDIADKFTCIWIGGGVYDDGSLEYNLNNDFHAANTVFSSSAELWQVPMEGYSQMQISYAELELKVMPCGNIGKYLFDELQQVGMSQNWVSGESWALGDSPAPALAFNPNCGQYVIKNAPVIGENKKYIGEHPNRPIRVYTDIDSRFIFEDFFAKLALFTESKLK